MNEPTTVPEKRTTVTFTTTPEMKALIIFEAEQDERSVSVFLNRILRDILKQPVNTSQQTQ